jgi:predicted  nucleic acid-binding Zn-ribbon protein
MDKTVRALEDLSATDGQLRGDAPLTDAFIRTLEKRRTALRDAIPESFLLAYDALGRMGRRPAVVAIRKAHCGGCYLRLPPQLESAIRRRQSLPACPHCRRLLYSPSEDASAAKPEPERLPVKVTPPKRLSRFPERRSTRERRPPAARSTRRRV